MVKNFFFTIELIGWEKIFNIGNFHRWKIHPRERERDRQTDRETDRPRDRQTKRQTDRQRVAKKKKTKNKLFSFC